MFPAATQNTSRGWNCLLLFGVKSLHLFIVEYNLFHHSKIVPLVLLHRFNSISVSDTSRTILVVKLEKICQ